MLRFLKKQAPKQSQQPDTPTSNVHSVISSNSPATPQSDPPAKLCPGCFPCRAYSRSNRGHARGAKATNHQRS